MTEVDKMWIYLLFLFSVRGKLISLCAEFILMLNELLTGLMYFSSGARNVFII